MLTYSFSLQLLHMCVMPTPAACPLTDKRKALPTLFTFCLLLCLYSFHSLCVCNICMSVLNVPCGCDKIPKSINISHLRNHERRISFWICFAAATIVFFVIFIVLVYCAYIIAHIYYGILMLYCKNLGKSFTLSRKTFKTHLNRIRACKIYDSRRVLYIVNRLKFNKHAKFSFK